MPETHTLTDEQRRIVRDLMWAYGEGLSLAVDIADELGIGRRGIGQKLAALERLGLVKRARIPRYKAPVYGWELTPRGAEVAEGEA